MITNNSNRIYFKGYCRGIILIQGQVQFIPVDLIDYINEESREINIEYENFISQNQLKVFNCDTINFKWDSYSIISNVIYELSDHNDFRIINFIQNVLLCKLIIIKINDSNRLNVLLKFLKSEIFVEVYLIIYFTIENKDFFKSIINFPNVTKIFINSDNFTLSSNKIYLRSIPNKYSGNLIHINPNFELISESQYHHTYFNRKLYIGPNGEIKNAPECEETFGSIKDLDSVEDLKEIISTPAFQKYWFVHKDLCDVCKHCEFRHMCVDNRMPFERADNQWYHKIECNYNPFIAKWEGEIGYRTLSECRVFSNENEFSIDHDRIAEINKEIWEEE